MFKIKICKVCNKEFKVEGQKYNGFFRPSVAPWNLQTCSDECRHQNGLRIAKEQGIRKKTKIVKRKCRYCKKEVISTTYCPRSFCEGKAGECYKKFLSETRTGTNNPRYTFGLRLNKNRGVYTSKHLKACSKYRKYFFLKSDYLFCEKCGINENGALRFEVHHIMQAGLYPRHKELHNFSNLIMLCVNCHNEFHSANCPHNYWDKVIRDRKLDLLFRQ